MSTRDLFEMASMDVLGLLDEDERRDFERAFRSAAPEIQAQIRREQLRVAEIEDWLPPVDPPAGLKVKVVGAVREAMEAVRAGRAREHVARKWGPFATALQRSVSPLWRAAAIGLATATLVAGYGVMYVSSKFNQVTRESQSQGALAALATESGARFSRVLQDPAVRLVAFNRGPGAAEDKDYRAGLYQAGVDGGYLYCTLPKVAGGYRLVIVSEDGERIEREVASFDPSGQQVITLKEAIPAGTRLAILARSAGDNLASALLVTYAA